MSFTYSDQNPKVVLHSWGRFRGAVEEAVVVGDLLAVCEDADSGFQLANVTGTLNAVAVACENGAADETIWMAIATELKAPVSVGAGGAVTPTYFATADCTMGSKVYLSTTAGKLSSTSDATVIQPCGYILARDRVLVIPTGYISGDSLSLSGSLLVGTTLGVSGATTLNTLAVSGTATFSGNVAVPQGDYIYLAGQGLATYIYSDTENSISIVGSSYIILDAGYIQILTNDKLYLRDVALYSSATGKLVVNTYGLGANQVAITGHLQLAGNLEMPGGTGGDITMSAGVSGTYSITLKDGVADGLSIKTTAADMIVFNTTADTVNIICDLNIATTKYLYLGTGVSIRSQSDGKMHILVTNATASAITVETGNGGCLNLACFLHLLVTTDVGANEGDFWYDGTTKKLHYWNGTTECEVTASA